MKKLSIDKRTNSSVDYFKRLLEKNYLYFYKRIVCDKHNWPKVVRKMLKEAELANSLSFRHNFFKIIDYAVHRSYFELWDVHGNKYELYRPGHLSLSGRARCSLFGRFFCYGWKGADSDVMELTIFRAYRLPKDASVSYAKRPNAKRFSRFWPIVDGVRVDPNSPEFLKKFKK